MSSVSSNVTKVFICFTFNSEMTLLTHWLGFHHPVTHWLLANIYHHISWDEKRAIYELFILICNDYIIIAYYCLDTRYPTVAANHGNSCHYNDVIISAMASQNTGVPIVCSTIGSGADERKHWKLLVTGLCAVSPGNSPHKRPVTRKYFHSSHHGNA